MKHSCFRRSPMRFPVRLGCLWIAIGSVFAAGVAFDPKPGGVSVIGLDTAIVQLKPLHERIAKPGPNDWLARHEEPGQTFRQYVTGNPVVPQGKRRTLYIQPLGEFTANQRKIVKQTADFMALFFNLPVKIQDDIALSVIPAKARRVHPSWGEKQILTSYVLDEVLRPKLPDDAAACIAFTASDLWPGEGWNFVFGEASLTDRVAIWSIHRNGNPDENTASYNLCLLRTLKTAVHETAHMFTMFHCTLYECGMCGSNHREESDRRPLWFCPECTAKVCWGTGTAPGPLFVRLSSFCEVNGLTREAEFYRRSALALGEKVSATTNRVEKAAP